jgi:hypothetical protein
MLGTSTGAMEAANMPEAMCSASPGTRAIGLVGERGGRRKATLTHYMLCHSLLWLPLSFHWPLLYLPEQDWSKPWKALYCKASFGVSWDGTRAMGHLALLAKLAVLANHELARTDSNTWTWHGRSDKGSAAGAGGLGLAHSVCVKIVHLG